MSSNFRLPSIFDLLPELRPQTPAPTLVYFPIKLVKVQKSYHQTKALKALFKRTMFPTTTERHAVARQLEIDPKAVQIWFQNQRQKLRSKSRQSSSI
ncbi:hypothetical protein DSO57_1003944 [Entomophthora muscae]|uniref:Uncharacterized protein n=2 Tax=Entomophthora muscae TaxID=34485 RepID=A0ACC2RJI1_9FUNG|nr:hypothetical protein DSO57_1016380 [Entomophthora muscae]KAJ9055447.1 hypothetical protein DSO57_1003944 [Entomophthora muscae]